MRRFFPGDYRVVLPGRRPGRSAPATASARGSCSSTREERAALRLFLRALRRLDPQLDWEATVVSARGPSSSTPLRNELRERITFADDGADAALAAADVVVAASDGAAPAPGVSLARAGRRRRAAGRAPARLRGASSRTAAGCSSSPATARCWPPSSPA